MNSKLKKIIDQIPKKEERRKISGLAELKERWIADKCLDDFPIGYIEANILSSLGKLIENIYLSSCDTISKLDSILQSKNVIKKKKIKAISQIALTLYVLNDITIEMKNDFKEYFGTIPNPEAETMCELSLNQIICLYHIFNEVFLYNSKYTEIGAEAFYEYGISLDSKRDRLDELLSGFNMNFIDSLLLHISLVISESLGYVIHQNAERIIEEAKKDEV